MTFSRETRATSASSLPFLLIMCIAILLPAYCAADGTAVAEIDSSRIFDTEDVVVSASRYASDVHLSHSNISRQDLQSRIGVLDIPQLLEDTPGVYATSESGNGIGYTTLKIRGFDQKRIGVMVNGIPFNDPEDHQVYWVDIPDFASNLEDIQIQRGITNSMGATTAIGGTVNMITDAHGRDPEAEISMMMGDYETRRLTAAYRTGELSNGLSSVLRYSHLDSDGYRDWSASDMWSLFWSSRHRSEKMLTQLNIYTGHEETQLTYYGVEENVMAGNRTYNPMQEEEGLDSFKQPHYELHNSWYPNESIEVKNAVYFVRGEGFYENLKAGRDIVDFSLDLSLRLDTLLVDEAGIPADEVDLVRRKNVIKKQLGWVPHLAIDHDKGRTILGGDVYRFTSDHWGDVTGLRNLPELPGLSQYEFLDDVRYYGYDGEKTAWSLFLNERREILPGLTLMADLQYQHKTYDFMQDEVGHFTKELRNAYTVDYDFFNPKGGLHWRLPVSPLGGETSIYAHTGITHREPTDSELFDTWSGPDDLGAQPLFRNFVKMDATGNNRTDYVQWSDPYVSEEKALNHEVGFSWRGTNVSWTINGYLMQFDDEILPYGALNKDGLAIRGNAESTLHRGVELGFSARILHRHLLKLAASRSWDKFDRFIYNEIIDWETGESIARDYSGNPLALFPEHLLSVSLQSILGPLDTLLRVRGVGKQYLDNTGDETRVIDAYTVVDLAVGVELGRLGVGSSRDLRLDLRFRNILDERYATNGYWDWGNYYFPAAGRNMMAGLNYAF